MRVISFFSAKGGTGKTTFNMLMASYLKYVLGKRVIVFDFDAPENNLSTTREREVDALLEKDPEADTSRFYPVRKIQATSIPGIREAIKDLRSVEGEYDYLIVDAPGSLSDADATSLLLVSGVLSFAAIPTDIDGMSIASSYSLGVGCQTYDIPFLIFFNRVVWQEKKELYESFRQMFTEGGMKVSANRIRHTVKLRRDSDNAATYLRSSIRFPEKDIRATIPELINLFEEILDYVGKEKTEKTT